MPIDLETPAIKIATAQAVLSLTFRLSAEVHSGRIGVDIFGHEVTIVTGNSGLLLRAAPELTVADLEAGMENLKVIALSASALTLASRSARRPASRLRTSSLESSSG